MQLPVGVLVPQETLHADAAALNEELAAITASLSEGDYIDPDADPEQVGELLKLET